MNVPRRNKEIMIELENDSPPCGKVLTAEQEALTFVGWLGLIRALSETVEATPAPGGLNEVDPT